jgi:DNA-binding MarR family transcriptional regulator
MCVRTHLFRARLGFVAADDEKVLAWAAVLRAHAAVVGRLEREMQAARGGLSLSWYDVLLSLYRAPDRRLRMQDLAAAVVLSRTRVSRVVDELDAAGLVRREPNPADGRSTLVGLTPKGRAAFRAAAPVYLRGIAQHFTDLLTEDELACVRTALEKVVAAHPDG